MEKNAMKLYEICAKLDNHKKSKLMFKLPCGKFIPEHFHVTEIQEISKKVFYCNQTSGTENSVNFQLWVYTDEEHRIDAAKLLKIINKSNFRTDTDVFIEHDEITLGKYGIENLIEKDGYLIFELFKVSATCADPYFCLKQEKTSCSGAGCC